MPALSTYVFGLATLSSCVSAHGIITSITGANNVTMPGLSVIDGTPRGCPSPNCGAEADTTIFDSNEPLGRTLNGGTVKAAKNIAIFMGSSSGTSGQQGGSSIFGKRQFQTEDDPSASGEDDAGSAAGSTSTAGGLTSLSGTGAGSDDGDTTGESTAGATVGSTAGEPTDASTGGTTSGESIGGVPGGTVSGAGTGTDDGDSITGSSSAGTLTSLSGTGADGSGANTGSQGSLTAAGAGTTNGNTSGSGTNGGGSGDLSINGGNINGGNINGGNTNGGNTNGGNINGGTTNGGGRGSSSSNGGNNGGNTASESSTGGAPGEKTARNAVEDIVSSTAGQGAKAGLPTADDDGTISLTLHQVNQDGAGPFKAAIDSTSGGTDASAFEDAEVTSNVAGFDSLSTTTTTDFPIKVQVPKGTVCSGTAGGAKNVCIVKLQNSAQAGPFGGSAAFTQTAAARKRAVESRRRRLARRGFKV